MSQENNINMLFYIIIALTIVVVLMATTAYANSQAAYSKETESTIQMTGKAESMVTPDTAQLSIGVVIQAQNSSEASQQNAAIMSNIVDELKQLGLEDREIQTSYVSVYPVYNYDGKATIEGYSASNSVQVTTTKLDILSQIIDRSAAAGANQIGGIQFTVSEDKQKEMREKLINEAVADASSKATMLADSLDVSIAGVQSSSISDNTQPNVYYDRMEETAMDQAAPSTPVEPGESRVSLTVHVTYIIN
ncbi:MAG: SIMPL domain-containing protein [Methanolobus sp.]|uniref:SIMPL domain-containing protein n=1 Tax=Methanolobus sp. TaxID=1874737 RepID=UPI0027312E63|nr:SIMPL domain-containing protein [Methanolobus sp.]MDP2217996.1 SIMPL domain-containing protein [Methanolobus sp.]